MMSRKIGALFIILTFFVSGMSGCFSSESIGPEPYGVPGGLALACLKSDSFSKLIIEVDYEDGYKPRSETMDLLVERLSSVCDKSQITYELWLTVFEHDSDWSDDEIREMGRDTRRSNAMAGDELRFHLLFPSGSHERDGVLGIVVDASTAMIFVDDIKNAENMLGRPSWQTLEASVTVHEAGHLLGLVNLVYTSPIDHEDPNHPGHSNNDESVMYWAVESSDISNVIFGTVPNDFDDDDRADLAAMANGDIEVEDQLWNPK